jgi:hypothetical protein
MVSRLSTGMRNGALTYRAGTGTYASTASSSSGSAVSAIGGSVYPGSVYPGSRHRTRGSGRIDGGEPEHVIDDERQPGPSAKWFPPATGAPAS